jgi:predicted TIM-barrel fold metal-dependent hydrolase
MLIDGHAHILEPSSPFSEHMNGDPDLLLRMLDDAGMDRAVVFGIAPYGRNEFVAETCEKHPDRLSAFVSVQPTGSEYFDRQPAITHLRESLTLYPFKGVKLHPRIQAFSLSDPRHIPLFETISELGLPVLIDCISQSSPVPLADNLPFEVDRLLRRVPGLKVILAHMGGHRVLDAYCVALSHPDVYLDLAWVLHLYQGSSVEQDVKFVVGKLAPSGRIIFGSDFPIFDRANTLPISVSKDMCMRMFDEIGLDEEAVSAVMGGTMAHLLGLD